MEALKGGAPVVSGEGERQPLTFLILYGRYAVMCHNDFTVQLHDLVTKRMVVEDTYLQALIARNPLHIEDISLESTDAKCKELVAQNVPFVARGACLSWGSKEWSFETFSESPIGDATVHVSMHSTTKTKSNCADRTVPLTMREYITSFDALTVASEVRKVPPPYLRAFPYLTDPLCEPLRTAVSPPSWASDLFEKMEEKHRPAFQWLFLGPKGVHTPLHIDPALTHAWMAQIQGSKRWRLVPPTKVANFVDQDGFASLKALDAERFPNASMADVLEVVVNEGDIIFVPNGWAHEVDTLEHSISVTHNFIDSVAFKKVVRHACLGHVLTPKPPQQKEQINGVEAA